MPRVFDIQLRRDTTANWAAADAVGRVLDVGEPGYDTQLGIMRIGDGVTAWGSLPDPAGAGWTAQSKQLISTAASLANRDFQRFNMVVIGDSLTEGTGATNINFRWTNRLQQRMRYWMPTTGLPVGGRGYLNWRSTGTATFTWPCVAAGSPPAQNGFGVKQAVADLTSVAMTLTYSLVCTSADIIWTMSPIAGAGWYSWDAGVTKNAFSSSGSTQSGQLTRTIAPPAPGAANTLTIGWTSGHVFVSGVIEYNGDENLGIQIHDAGLFGVTTVSWLGGGASSLTWPADIAALNPHLFVMFLGSNDQANNLPPTNIPANLLAIMTAIRTHPTNTNVPWMFLVPCGFSGAFTFPWSQYIAQIKATAVANGFPYLDLTQRFPLPGDALTYGLYADTVHWTNKGNSLAGDLIATGPFSPAVH